MGRKDRERFLKLKSQNPHYLGFRGRDSGSSRTVAVTETLPCSICNRRRNVPADSVPEDRSSYVCLRCQEEQAEEAPVATTEEPE